jgi:hypothetical protein
MHLWINYSYKYLCLKIEAKSICFNNKNSLNLRSKVTLDAQMSHWILPLFNREMANKTNCRGILNTADVICRKRPLIPPSWVEKKNKKIFSVRLFIATVLGYVVCIIFVTEGRDYDWVFTYE